VVKDNIVPSDPNGPEYAAFKQALEFCDVFHIWRKAIGKNTMVQLKWYLRYPVQYKVSKN
jgi:hypothetical protein